MWSVVIGGVVKVVEGWFTTKRAKQEAEAQYHMALAKGEQDWDIMAMKNSQFSWKDEFITLVWFAPLIVAWWYPERAMAWVDFVSLMPFWYQVCLFGIIAASFGLRWWFKQQGMGVVKK